MKFNLLAAAAAVSIAVSAGAAAARDLPAGGLTAEEIAAWLQGHGYTTKISPDGDGERKIGASSNGINWEIWLYACQAHRCRSMQYAAGWPAEGMTLDKLNVWNRDKRYIRAYMGPGGVFGEYDIDLHGGTWEQVDQTLTRWNDVAAKFRTYIGK